MYVMVSSALPTTHHDLCSVESDKKPQINKHNSEHDWHWEQLA